MNDLLSLLDKMKQFTGNTHLPINAGFHQVVKQNYFPNQMGTPEWSVHMWKDHLGWAYMCLLVYYKI